MTQPAAAEASQIVNVAAHLAEFARTMPDQAAVVVPTSRDADGRRRYRSITFAELDRDSDRLARGLRELGVTRGTRLALLVKPGIDFISLVFALFKAGAITILIDPGMGRKNLLRCLHDAKPEGFVAISPVQAVRCLLPRFRSAHLNITVGRRWFWGGKTIDELRGGPWSGPELAPTTADDPAAIIFTTGSTGPPKGVLYRHGNFDRQVTEIRDFYGIEPGGVDLAGFPLFGLFNCAMGATTVVPDMDASRPATTDPANIVEAVRDCGVTQAFASPAVWNRVGPYCAVHNIRLPTLRRVMSAGAAVPAYVLERMKECIADDGQVDTPYGATEALPVASISADEVLNETAERTRQGAGTCVGRRFPGIEWRVVRAVDGPIEHIDDAKTLPQGEIGELIVRGPVVTREYVTRTEWNALAKIADGDGCWHRMGDVGYLDEQQRFWYCGRLSQRVLTDRGVMYTECCEAIFNQHPAVFRSALVGVGPAGRQRPVIVIEPLVEQMPLTAADRAALVAEMRAAASAHRLTQQIDDFLLFSPFPVDIRHNAKIFREKLAAWAAAELNA
ncbi:MAG TPA: fatty acid CoA ligase family protein [Pirellulales bacterium]|nr:fatty acid CoA ligase family protein [Pirellulales bacterium]